MSESLVPVVDTGQVKVFVGDTVAVLPTLEAGSVGSVVTDPPYGLEFCGQRWDGTAGFLESLSDVDTAGMSGPEVFEVWCHAWAAGVLRVLEPGGHLAAFGGTRTWHRMARGVESAGFEIRDQIAWLYSTGMPKSMDLSHAADQHLGRRRADRIVEVSDAETILGRTTKVIAKGEPVTDQARKLQGWGTGLRPGFEPILIARKPFDGSLVANAVARGTGGLNIDGARFGAGRWPVNVALDGEQAAALDMSAGGDGGLVSARFPVFRHDHKAPAVERPAAFGVAHTTVKPLGLMRWLVRMLTPPGKTVLEPFAGSGTTVEAALLEGFPVVAIEKDELFVPLIQSRMDKLG